MVGRIVGIVVVAFVLPGTLRAYGQNASPPGPEIQRLGVWVGTTRGEVVYKQDPQRVVQLMTTCEWVAGNTQVECRQETLGPGAKSARQWRMSYDPDRRTYKVLEVSSNGQTRELTTTVSGNTWTWTTDGVREGKPAKLRATYEVSATSLTTKTEASPDGKSWTVIAEGKGAKVK